MPSITLRPSPSMLCQPARSISRRTAVVQPRALLSDALDTTAATECVKLTPPSGGASIVLFGAIHAEMEAPHVADYILRHRPKAVVVETAVDSVHGAATGAIITRDDCLMRTRNGDPRAVAFAQYGAQLAAVADPTSSLLWGDLRRFTVSEQLAYIAAFAVDAEIVFGDRCKAVTYLRMLRCPSLADLDAAFGFQALVNYAQIAPILQMTVAAMPLQDNCTERVFMLERDAILLETLQKASLKAGAGNTVVGVVGASHLRSMQRLWETGQWRHILDEHQPHIAPPPLTNETPEMVGVRRALFDGVIRLTCRPDVQMDIERSLERIPPAGKEADELTAEMYGSSRMLLAVLGKDALQQVCGGWRCDMWQVLQPLRDIRPVNGGPGYNKELVLELRTLNFEVG